MGKKYAVFDSLGFPIAFYDDEIHEQIPSNAIEISDEMWLEFINNQGKRFFDFANNQLKEFDPKLMKIENNQIVYKTLKDLKREKLEQLRFYVSSLLSQIDWVVIKLQSLVNEGWSEEEIQAEKEKYKEILEQRRKIREWNRQIEQAIQDAQTLEELEEIRIEFVE